MKKSINSIITSIRWARLASSLAIAVLAAFAASATANAQVLFSSQEDFAGWTVAGNGSANLTFAQSAADLDGVAINGLGNLTAPGAAGTPGCLAVSEPPEGYDYQGWISPDESGNAALMTLLKKTGKITFKYNLTNNGGYLYSVELYVLLNGNQYIIAPTSPKPEGTQGPPNIDGTNYIATYDFSLIAALMNSSPVTSFAIGGNLNGFLGGDTMLFDAIVAIPAPPPSTNAVGVHFVNAGGTGVNNSSPDALAPTSGTGVVLQTNWNNLGKTGDSVTLYDGRNNATSLSIEWDSDSAQSTTTFSGGGLAGTPFGALFDGFITTASAPAIATPLGTDIYSSSANNKPCIWIGGLKAWYQAYPGAVGYNIILYACGQGWWEDEQGFVESASGSPLANTMVEGDVLRPPLYDKQTGNQGSFIPITATQNTGINGSGNYTSTWGGDYMEFDGLTNDAVLIRLQCLGGGAGINGFQIVPTANAAPALPSVTLAITSLATNSTDVVLTNAMNWSAGVLQKSTSLFGPWTSDYTPSPQTNSTGNSVQFYRVLVGH